MTAAKSGTKKQRIPKREVSAIEASESLGISLEQVRRNCRDGAPHTKRDGRLWLNCEEFAAWRLENGKTGQRGIHADDMNPSPTLEAARLRKENAMAARHELWVSRQRGQLLPIDSVRFWETQRTIVLRNRLMGLAAKLTPLLEGRDGAERHQIIDDAIRDALEGAGADIDELQRKCIAAEEN